MTGQMHTIQRPKTMHCSLAAPRVRQWLATTRQARILHLFGDVCNLVNENGAVLALVLPRVGPGPFSAVVTADEAPWEGLDVATAVAVRDAAVLLGTLRIRFDCATLWHPSPNWTCLRDKSAATWPAPRPLAEPFASLLAQLLSAIQAESVARMARAAGALAGRGSGLTPTGDDVLMGVLYGLWVRDPRPEWLALLVDTAVARTTTLSAAFLRAARAGEATLAWHRLADGQPDAVAQIHAIGYSSGAEAWAGFVATCAALSRVQTP